MKVIAPRRCKSYFTEGKEYDVFNVNGNLFNIKTDLGYDATCLFERCSHLYGGNWIIKDERLDERLKKYNVLFIREGENISTGITYHSETVTGALRKFFSENKNALFLSVSSEDLFKLKY